MVGLRQSRAPERERVLSVLLGVLPRGAEAPGITEALDRLRAGGLPLASLEPAGEHARAGARWELELTLRLEGRARPASLRAWLEPSPRELLKLHAGWRGAAEVEDALGTASTWSLGVSMRLTDAPLLDYQWQLRALTALAPEATVVLDTVACSAHPASRIRELARASTPPPSTLLFSVHSVLEREEGARWMHTHGLRRCGCEELEMLDVPAAQADLFGALLNTVACLFMEHGMPAVGEPFEPAQGVQLAWLPAGDALGRLGTPSTEQALLRDEAHPASNAVLLAPERGFFGRSYRPIAAHARALEAEPLLYLSHWETMRQAMLSQERLDRFVALQRRFGASEDWMFLVKLGYPIPGAGEEEREHLWFSVHGFDGRQVDATLTNQPHYVPGLQEGQRGSHALEKLSGWLIVAKDFGKFGPDELPLLERRLEERDAGQKVR